MRILASDGMDKSAIAALKEMGHEVVEQFYEIGRASVGKECVRRCRSRWSPYH